MFIYVYLNICMCKCVRVSVYVYVYITVDRFSVSPQVEALLSDWEKITCASALDAACK